MFQRGRQQRRAPAYDPRTVGALCDSCPLSHKIPVLPNGPHNAEVAIVGEAPGYNEEQRGVGFCGASGQVLDEMLREIGADRKKLWITNSLLCRPEVPDLKGTKRYDLPTFLAWVRKENMRLKKRAKVTREAFVPIRSPLDCCKPRLWNELRHIEANAQRNARPNGAIVIAFGNYALQAIAGHLGIMKYRGSPLPIDVPPAGGPAVERGT